MHQHQHMKSSDVDKINNREDIVFTLSIFIPWPVRGVGCRGLGTILHDITIVWNNLGCNLGNHVRTWSCWSWSKRTWSARLACGLLVDHACWIQKRQYMQNPNLHMNTLVERWVVTTNSTDPDTYAPLSNLRKSRSRWLISTYHLRVKRIFK